MKPFDSELYDRDDHAKHVVIEWLKTYDITARVNPDDYGIDLLGYRDNESYEIEVEVKHSWKGRRFPFESLHYSARKLKFLNTTASVKFITLNHEWTRCAVVDGDDLSSAQIVKKKTKYTDLEEFIEIPRHQIKWGDIDANL